MHPTVSVSIKTRVERSLVPHVRFLAFLSLLFQKPGGALASSQAAVRKGAVRRAAVGLVAGVGGVRSLQAAAGPGLALLRWALSPRGPSSVWKK